MFLQHILLLTLSLHFYFHYFLSYRRWQQSRQTPRWRRVELDLFLKHLLLFFAAFCCRIFYMLLLFEFTYNWACDINKSLLPPASAHLLYFLLLSEFAVLICVCVQHGGISYYSPPLRKEINVSSGQQLSHSHHGGD